MFIFERETETDTDTELEWETQNLKQAPGSSELLAQSPTQGSNP